MTTRVVLENLTKTYGGQAANAVESFSLEIRAGKIAALLGPSGSGKSTTLKMIAGLIVPTAGAIYFDDVDVSNVPTERRNAVMVFQNHLLFPHMTVAENIGFGLRMRGINKATREARVAEMLELVRLPDVGKRKPSQLSGGQQQRIALARALITNPRVLLLDEPLSNLDVHLRDEMRELILRVQRERQVTTVLVTHDQQEAVLLADQIALMFEGALQQVGTPSDFYRYPKSKRVAQFFGGVNFLGCLSDGKQAETALGVFQLAASMPIGEHMLTIRPEQVRMSGKPGEVNSISGQVVDVIYGGTTTRYRVQVNGETLEIIRGADLPGVVKVGEAVWLYLPPEHLWLL